MALFLPHLTSSGRLVRRIPGFQLDRMCVEVGSTRFLWIDVPRHGGQYWPSTTQPPALDACRAALARQHLPLHTIVPTLALPPAYVYEAVPSSELLYDALVALRGIQGLELSQLETESVSVSDVVALSSKLGTFLGILHATTLRHTEEAHIPRTTPDITDVGAFLEGPTSGTERHLLAICRTFPLLMDLAHGAHDQYAADDFVPVFLHGKFSTAAIGMAAGHGLPVVLGWLDLSYGPQAFDVGYLLAEFIELSSLPGRTDLPSLDLPVTAFMNAYIEASASHLPARFAETVAGYTALRVVSHMLMNARHLGIDGREDAVAMHLEKVMMLVHDWVYSFRCPRDGTPGTASHP